MSQAMIDTKAACASTAGSVGGLSPQGGEDSASASPAAQARPANAGAQTAESSPSASEGGSSDVGETLLGAGMNANPAATGTKPPYGDKPPYGNKPLPDNASDDQRAEFDRKLRALNGVPQNAADYGDFGLGDSMQINTEAEDYKYYTELFKDVGLSKAQAGKLLQKHLEYMQGQAEHYQKTNDAQIQEYRNKVKNDFVRQCGGEQAFIEFSQTASRGFQAAAQGAGLSEKDVRGILNVMGDDPRFLRIFNSIGKLYREDVLVTGSAPQSQEKSFEQMFRGMFAHS